MFPSLFRLLFSFLPFQVFKCSFVAVRKEHSETVLFFLLLKNSSSSSSSFAVHKPISGSTWWTSSTFTFAIWYSLSFYFSISSSHNIVYFGLWFVAVFNASQCFTVHSVHTHTHIPKLSIFVEPKANDNVNVVCIMDHGYYIMFSVSNRCTQR